MGDHEGIEKSRKSGNWKRWDIEVVFGGAVLRGVGEGMGQAVYFVCHGFLV